MIWHKYKYLTEQNKERKDFDKNSTSKNNILSLIVDANTDIKKNLFAFKVNDKGIKEVKKNHTSEIITQIINARLGNSAKRISYKRNKLHYIFRLLLNYIFFILITGT